VLNSSDPNLSPDQEPLSGNESLMELWSVDELPTDGLFRYLQA
jgi:hypothetical protein